MIFHHHFLSIKSLFQFVIEQVNYLKFLTDWIYYVHVLYTRVPTLNEYFDDR